MTTTTNPANPAATPSRRRLAWTVVGWLVAFAVLASLPLVLTAESHKFYIELLSKVMIMAIFALSLQLLIGYTGLVSLGHAAYFAMSAYATAMLAPESGAGNGWLLMLGGVGAAGALALVVGALVLRTRGIYFIMVTLAFAQMVYFVFHDTKIAGGSDGTYIYFRPEFGLFSELPLTVNDPVRFYWLVLGALVLTVALLALLLRSRFGHALVGIRHNEQRMRAAGFATYRYQLGAFVAGGMLAGLAGFLYAIQFGFVNPEIASASYGKNVPWPTLTIAADPWIAPLGAETSVRSQPAPIASQSAGTPASGSPVCTCVIAMSVGLPATMSSAAMNSMNPSRVRVMLVGPPSAGTTLVPS